MIENIAFEKTDDQWISVAKSTDNQMENKEFNHSTRNKDKLKVKEMDEQERKKEKLRIWKNIFLISAAFLCNFTAYQNLARLQSSLNLDEGMGVVNQALVYTALVLSCFFLPHIVIAKLGHKFTITFSFFAYILWMAANGIPAWWSLTPTSILVGLAAGPLWTAQCAYFAKMASRYSKVSGETQPVVITKFFGVFFMFFQTCKLKM